MYLIFDTETTGLPLDYNASITNVNNWPRVVQIAWACYNDEWILLEEFDYIIYPKDFKIPIKASLIHGITQKIAKEKWEELDKILDKFTGHCNESSLIICHNYDFDSKVIWSEYIRYNKYNPLNDKDKFCTMLAWVDICKIPRTKNKYKFPTLNELYIKLFNKSFINAHDALADVRACAKCFFQIYNQNHLTKNENHNFEKSEKNILKFDKIAENALEMMNSNLNVFLTGKAGTGKTTLLKHFITNTIKNIVVLAPTWVAAINVWWSTIHSFFKFSPTITIDEAINDWIRANQNKLYKQLEVIIIDEISMVRADLLDCINVFLQNSRENNKPFGWVQMIFVGDLYQLPPVVTSRERDFFQTQYSSPYFFDSKIIKQKEFDFEFIELQKIYRQRDNNFINILNAIRNKTINESHIQDLNKRVVWQNFDIHDGEIYLAWKNAQVEIVNKEKLDKIEERPNLFYAEIKWNFTKSYYPTDEILEFKIWAQIMFVANDKYGRWVNWTLGKITEIQEDAITVQIYNWESVDVWLYTWEVKHYVFDRETRTLSSSVVWSFTQFPITLAWAVTIHKSQWKTFEKVIIDLTGGTFVHWQAYVALSRCTSLDWISLVVPIKSGHIIMDWKVIDFVTKFQYSKSEKLFSLEDKTIFIEEAIFNKQKLEITYLKAKDEKSQRVLIPKRVWEMFYSNKPFLWVEWFCETARENRVFRIDRILEMKMV